MNKVKNKIFLSLMLLVLLSAAFLYLGHKYLVKEVETLSSELINTKKELNRFEVRNDGLLESRREYNNIKSEIENISKIIVAEDRIVDFIERVEKVAENDGVRLRISSNNKAEKKQSEQSYISQKSFDLTAGGDFNSIMHFLYSLENFDYYINVENINVGFGDFDEINKGVIVLDANITVYQKQNE